MGNYIIEVETDTLKNIIKKADKVCGTLEPSMRKLAFFISENMLYLTATDGCLTGYFPVAPFYSKSLPPFQIPLDVVKQFVSELSGKISLIFQDGILSFKAQNELLRLKTIADQREKEFYIPKLLEYVTFSKRKLVTELDFVSSFLEEGSYADWYYSGLKLEMISHHIGLVAYSNLEREKEDNENNVNIERFSISIPYVSTRHLIKVLESDESESVYLAFDSDKRELIVKSENIYTTCSDFSEHEPGKVRDLCARFTSHVKIHASHFQRLLRRALISGRFSDVEIYSRHGEIVVISQHGSVAYKGSIPVSVESEFSVKTKAYMLRSAINRIGSQYISIGVVDDYVLMAPPSTTRFLILKNQRIQQF
ncbi:hypothetical protein [Fervidobacterium sp.]